SQGWRRFTWKNIMAGSFHPLLFPPENNMHISGRVLANNGKPVMGGKVTLFSSSGDIFLRDTLTDNEGRFDFNNLFFHDSTKFAVQAKNVKDRKNVEIQLNALPPQMVTNSKNAATIEVNVNNSMNAYLKNSRNQFDELRRYGMVNRSITLAEVKIFDKKPQVKNSTNLNGAGNADQIITAKDLENATDLSLHIEGHVAGIKVEDGKFYLLRYFTMPMLIVLDGMHVDMEYLRSINPRDIEAIEVLKSGANIGIYGKFGGGGVLVITTKQGGENLTYHNYAPGILSYMPKGFYKVREFYSPNYDDPKTNTKIADLRSTIYWNPHILTDKSGKASVEFFNADGAGSYVAILEGITAEGKLGRAIYRYRVN
ncbi:MAG TPA: TonB-dependent receptor plug domain-containing protein, partial [Daejeonella sp.]|nr:TonB-dependent receptor plug domain-containing protein [Daejeonella sp.]